MKLKHYKKRLGDGLWLGVPMDTYHAAPGLSSSSLRTLMRSPLEFWRMKSGAQKKETTSAMSYGTAAHSAIMENRFDAFHIQPATRSNGEKWSGNATECKEWVAAHSDKPILTAEQVQQISVAGDYVRRHPQVSKILCGGQTEVSAIAGGEKARCDYLSFKDDAAMVVDLKTCTDASTAEFSKEIINRGYHIQFAWYRRVLRKLGFNHFRFFFIALEKGSLPLVNVMELHPMAMDYADRLIADALILLSQCEANNYWPEWPDFDGTHEIKTVDLPAWAYPEPELTGAEEA